jgi:hypothetical protein
VFVLGVFVTVSDGAEDIAGGEVVLTIAEPPAVDMTLTRIVLAVCFLWTDCQADKWDGITPWFSGSCKCSSIFL